MTILPKNKNGCPYLILAPMEGLGDRCFRKAMASIGGYNEGVTEFLRVPLNAHVRSLASRYDAQETAPIPLAAQIMGSVPETMAEMAIEIAQRGAPRIDLNCGCPSNTVTGRGAGSSLLKEPNHLYKIASAMVKAVSVPVTAKLRSGFLDTSLFKENILAAQESGIRFLTLHPRTKAEGYGPPANWDLIAEAKSILKIPVVGNGDILNVEDALRMLRHTQCDALMIGRGSVINPFIFHEIQDHFSAKQHKRPWAVLVRYLNTYCTQILPDSPPRIQIGKVKQLLSFLFRSHPQLLPHRQDILRFAQQDMNALVQHALPLLKPVFETE